MREDSRDLTHPGLRACSECAHFAFYHYPVDVSSIQGMEQIKTPKRGDRSPGECSAEGCACTQYKQAHRTREEQVTTPVVAPPADLFTRPKKFYRTEDDGIA